MPLEKCLTDVCRHQLVKKPTSGSALTIGNFDGFHLGHQKLLEGVTHFSVPNQKELTRIAVGFYPHPREVLLGDNIPRLSNLRESRQILHGFGFDSFVLLRFTPALSRLSAQDFIDQYLLSRFDARSVVIGPDTSFGYKREANAERICAILEAKGCKARIEPLLRQKDQKVSSGAVRDALVDGQVVSASKMLGRNYALFGRVLRGDGRGKSIGIPTANLGALKQMVPRKGVYATVFELSGTKYPSVTNIGERPTFECASPGVSVESHLFDFRGNDFYNQRASVSFIARLRDEKKFSGKDELLKQINTDISQARQILL